MKKKHSPEEPASRAARARQRKHDKLEIQQALEALSKPLASPPRFALPDPNVLDEDDLEEIERARWNRDTRIPRVRGL